MTLVHLDLFHLDADLPLRTRAVTWAWIAVYAARPAADGASRIAISGASASRCRRPSGLPALVRVTLVGLAALLLGLGVALLLAPGWADGAWPWALTPLTGRAVGAWLVGLGVAAAHARLLDDRPSLRPLAITGVLFGLLQAVAVLRYGDELDGGLRSLAFGAVILVLASVSAWALWAPRPSAAATDPSGR